MKIEYLVAIALLISLLIIGCESQPLSLSCQVRVPEEFQQDPPGWIPPNGEPEAVRYKKSYEAFWWNCVMVKAADLNGRCPCTCSGTPAATYGCSDGAMDAEKQINHLLKNHNVPEVRQYLQTFIKDSDGPSKIIPYFPDGPRKENMIE